MSKHAKYVPRHRAPATPSRIAQVPAKAVRTTLVLSSVAVTGATVAGGVIASGGAATPAAAELSTASPTLSAAAREAVAADVADRGTSLSRSGDRSEAPSRVAARPAVPASRAAKRVAAAAPVAAKAAALSQASGRAVTRTVNITPSDPRDIARGMLGDFGFGDDQFSCLDSLWTRESGWRVNADNPSSSAYGIPQALPGAKMASAGADWATNPATQIRWGLGYIQDRYGSPCGAWAHSQSNGWY
ncbi:lytic transglycosylase domain-containing protein [Nocardioides sp. TRM66260-LWL]|uniref:aggregation-promoting factor C-terminal-like domain-containing protein n=1 Tax=Nocardioides sp. TRM66260-LWL TaxID=2874478 RepID=UPI001CC52931|nr:lytic transglycosylase domain-containing protein [Nocardioides sp. TRM66260-LWL]MBZ5736176.1 lytic transglycosylase domain-containing protein [Nocardioides sp. TRM66260-LWL]